MQMIPYLPSTYVQTDKRVIRVLVHCSLDKQDRVVVRYQVWESENKSATFRTSANKQRTINSCAVATIVCCLLLLSVEHTRPTVDTFTEKVSECVPMILCIYTTSLMFKGSTKIMSNIVQVR